MPPVTSEVPKTKIFVGRLPQDAESDALRTLFEKYGQVTECSILNRYGFVHMKTDEMASRAIKELNNTEFMGVRISVEQSTGQKSGRGGSRGGRGGGPMMRGGPGGRFGMRLGPYGRDDRRGLMGPPDRMGPPPVGRMNGYYDSYDRYGDDLYSRRGPLPPPPPPPMRPRDPYSYDREPEGRMDPYDRRPLPPPNFDRRPAGEYGGRATSDMYRRRSPPMDSGRYDDRDVYGPPARRYPPPPLDRDMPPRRF